MKIVFLDSMPANPGDLDWSIFEELGSVEKYIKTSPEETMGRIRNAEVIVTNKVKILAEHLEQCTKLKLICSLATGYDHINVEMAKKQGVTVCNVPDYSSPSVAQVTFALLLELTHHVGLHDQAVKSGEWTHSSYFAFWKKPLVELAGKTMLIVGAGNIGLKVAKIAEAMDMKVLVTSVRSPSQTPNPLSGEPLSPSFVTLEEGLKQADVVSVHVPATERTAGMINEVWLGWMKPTAFLINTARGALVDEEDLADALKNKQIAGYATDVLSSEPPARQNPLLNAPNCVITPHLAWASSEARQRLWQVTAENIKAFQAGKAQNIVD